MEAINFLVDPYYYDKLNFQGILILYKYINRHSKNMKIKYLVFVCMCHCLIKKKVVFVAITSTIFKGDVIVSHLYTKTIVTDFVIEKWYH